MSASHNHSIGEITTACRAVLSQLSVTLGTLVCPVCGAKVLLASLTVFLDAVIAIGDRDLAQGVAVTLERLAVRCREMRPSDKDVQLPVRPN